MVNIKNFTALICFDDDLRNLYFDIAESKGITPTWDVYHIQDGLESPKENEVQIMQEVFDNHILNNKLLLEKYELASINFRNNIKTKILLSRL